MTNLEITNAYIGDTQVEKIYLGADIVWGGGEPEPDYSKMPLTFKIISGGTIVWVAQNTAYTKTIAYKKNDGVWTSITSNTGASAPSISVNAGDIVQFRGDNAAYSDAAYYNSASFNSSAKFEAEGNIMSLVDSTGFTTATTLASSSTFSFLFRNCTGLTSAENLVLPVATLTPYCYKFMFNACTGLTSAPKLPATTLASECYSYMFSDCTSLTSAPELPATRLAEGCYSDMFSRCTSLKYIKCLATDISASNCTKVWVLNVASAGTFEGVPSTNWKSGNNGIPEGWTTNIPFLEVSVREIELFNQGDTASLDVSSTLPWSATSIPSWVSLSQTEGNGGVTTITITAITIPSTEVKDTLTITDTYKTVSITITNEQKDYSKMPLTFEMLSPGTIDWRPDTSQVLTFEYSLNDGPWTRVPSSVSIGVSIGDKVQFRGDNIRVSSSSSKYSNFNCSASFNAYGNIMSLLDSTGYTTATTLESANTFVGLFMDCRGLISAENLVLPATTLKNYCYNRMFRNCTQLLRGPELSLEVLNANGCYQNIFYGCSSLNYIKCLATNVTGTTYTNGWVTGVGTSGTFVKHPDAAWTTGTAGIPDGWTVVDATE